MRSVNELQLKEGVNEGSYINILLFTVDLLSCKFNIQEP